MSINFLYYILVFNLLLLLKQQQIPYKQDKANECLTRESRLMKTKIGKTVQATSHIQTLRKIIYIMHDDLFYFILYYIMLCYVMLYFILFYFILFYFILLLFKCSCPHFPPLVSPALPITHLPHSIILPIVFVHGSFIHVL